jgi:hypothetical protein
VAWNQVRELDDSIQQVLSLVAGASLCFATLVLWLMVAPFKPVHIGYTTLAVAAFIVVVLHELAHALAFTAKRGQDLRVGLAWRKWRLSMRYEGALSRGHYILVLAAPLAAISLLPVAVSCVDSLHSGDIVLVSMLNALSCGGDLTAALLVLAQVPAGALVRRQGDVVLWRTRAPRA